MIENYKELLQSEIIDLLKDENVNLALIQECVNRNNENINHLLNKLAKSNHLIGELYESIVELPETSSVLYYPNKDTFDYKSLSENVIIHIPESKKRTYKTLDPDSEFFLKIRVEKIKGSLLEYKSVEQTKTISSFLSKSYLGNALALTASLSIAVMLNSKIEHNAAASIRPASISASYDSPLMKDSDLAMHELKKLNSMKSVEELSNHDIKMIMSLTEEDEEAPVIHQSKTEIVEAISEVISPYIKEKHNVQKIAESLFETSKDRKVDYLLFLSIMKVETTTFNQDAVSSSGDLSIAQIKPEVWTEEFERLGKEPLDVKRLKKDSAYAIDRMGEILELQNKHKEKDPYWYARYHSKTPSKKLKYAKKVQEEYLKIKVAQIKEVEDKVDRILVALDKASDSQEFSHLGNFSVNFDRIESFKFELQKMKQTIVENKNKKISKMVASL